MRVLMVCLGNICRSPLAEGILQEKSNANKLNWFVDSAGTSGWHDGELPDSRSIEVARNNGIDISGQSSRKFTYPDFDSFDLILAMDSSNFTNISALAKTEDEKSKIKLILNYSYPNENRNVPDPYYEGGFDEVFNMLNKACDVILEYHKSK